MKANIVIRQPVNLGCYEAIDLQQGDKIVCRRCGEGEVEIVRTPKQGDAIKLDQFHFSKCDDPADGDAMVVNCECGGLLIYWQPSRGMF